MTEKKIAVKVDHVSKFFKLPTEATHSLRTTLVNRFRGIKGYKEQHVLKDISFEVEEGDFFGILGRNGSGKSTLLKIISQIYVPEKGSVTVNGKLVSFIELGVGFNPELTGRENVYMNGAMLGFTTAEIDAMYDDIVQFAELEEFMNQKLKNYSSGMQVRLAFSVAIKAQGDVLILDEVLAVGDEAFQRKCNDYFMERKKSGKTTILVTHDMGAVKKYCNKAVLIEKGLVKTLGKPEDVANQYSLDNVTTAGVGLSNTDNSDDQTQGQVPPSPVDNFRVALKTSPQLKPSDEAVFEFTYTVSEDIETHVAVSLIDIDTNIGLYNDNSMAVKTSGKGDKTLVFTCSLPYVNRLKYRLEASVRNEKKEVLAFASSAQAPVVVLDRLFLPEEDESEVDAATALLRRNSSWQEK